MMVPDFIEGFRQIELGSFPVENINGLACTATGQIQSCCRTLQESGRRLEPISITQCSRLVV
jgi:hypothetical protein